MIPFRMIGRSSYRPYAVFGLLLLNLAFFAWQIVAAAQAGRPFEELYGAYAFVPCLIGQEPIFDVLFRALRSPFLHGSFAALAVHLLFLWIFAPRVEAYYGAGRFLAFFGVMTLAGYGASMLLHGVNCVPLVGPGATLAGVLGAFFVLYPGQRVAVQLPYWGSHVLPAWLFIVAYMILQILEPAGGALSGTIAPTWHELGTFFAGLVLTFAATLFKPAPAADPFAHLDD